MSASDARFVTQRPERYAVVLNPRSGNGRAARQWREHEGRIRSRLGNVTLFETEYAGHGTELARHAIHEGYDRIVSAGGDGTHFEVINGFFEHDAPIRTDVSFAILPVGTASDLRKTHALPTMPEVIDLLNATRVVPVDIGRLRSTREDGSFRTDYFNTAVHMGLGSLVNEHVNKRSKALGPFLTFVLGVVSARMAYTPREMTVEADGAPFSGRFLEVVVAKGFYDGGGMHAAPHGTLDSGVFEVYMVGELGPLGSLLNVPRLYRGTQDKHPAVRYLRAKHVTVDCADRVLAGPDGETTGRLPVELDVMPKAVRVVTGPNPRLEPSEA